MRGSGRTFSVSAVWPQRRRRRRTRPTVCSAAQPAPRCLGTVSVEPLPPSPWWRRSLRVFARHQQNILCGTAFHPHDQIGCAASESSSPSRIGGSTPTSTLTGSARDGSARIGPPPESGRITTGGSRHPDRDHRGPAAAQHHTVGDLEHPGDGEGHASVQSHDGEAGTRRQCVIYGGRR